MLYHNYIMIDSIISVFALSNNGDDCPENKHHGPTSKCTPLESPSKIIVGTCWNTLECCLSSLPQDRCTPFPLYSVHVRVVTPYKVRPLQALNSFTANFSNPITSASKQTSFEPREIIKGENSYRDPAPWNWVTDLGRSTRS